METRAGEHIGPYRLLDQIGRGGMGQVFAAIHERMTRKVAIKVISPALASEPQIVGRFLQEARVLAQLQHPGIVQILHCDQLGDGRVYLAMEYLDGISLRVWLSKQRACDVAAVQRIGLQLADAMIEVHARGIVHRDLKPENIFVVPDESCPGGQRIKVLDFGIAKVPPSHQPAGPDTEVNTVGPMFLGTARYMAPEQCRNAAQVSDRADVYTLGVVLFEMIAGRPPFLATETFDAIAMHAHEPPPVLRELVPSVPVALEVLIASMLAKEPSQRPTMRRMREVLAQPWQDISDQERDCPLPGLLPFSTQHAELFFGREAEVQEILALLERVRPDGASWLLIEGPSGAGKSSLVRAGLLPALADQHASSPRWRIVYLRPSDDPIRSLTSVLSERSDDAGAVELRVAVTRALQAGDKELSSLVMARLPPGCVLLLIVDQLEELLALSPDAARSFLALLTSAVQAEDHPMRLLATARSDVVHRLEQRAELVHLFQKATHVPLHVMKGEGLVRVLQGMTQRVGLRLAEGLPERMVREAAGLLNPLPLLGHVLRGLWMPQDRTSVTHERYEALGGLSSALAQQAELVLAGLGEEGRERARWLILSLVQVGRGVADTRRPRTRREVLAAAGGDALADEILAHLSGGPGADGGNEASRNLRLITLSPDPDMPATAHRVELAHEMLLRHVPAITGWLDAERALLERHADLEVAAQAWEQSGCPSQGLPSGILLDHYWGQAGSPQRRLFGRMASERAQRFARLAQRLARRRRLLQAGLAAVMVLAAMAIAASAFRAWQERKRAEANLQHVILGTEQVVSHVDWVLARFHHTLEIRRNMLQHIDESLASLPAEEQSRVHVRRAVIQTKHRRGDLALHDETLAQAAERYAAARVLIRTGLERWPDDETLSFLMALNHSKQGKVALARGHLEDTRGELAAALALLEPGFDESSADERRTLATSYSEEADLALALGRPGRAAQLHERAIALIAQNDGDYDRSLQAFTRAQYAHAARLTGNLDGAANQLDRALVLQNALVDVNPGNAFFRWILGGVHLELAALGAARGRLDDAVAHYRTASALGQALHENDPTHKRYALLLCESLEGHEALARRHEIPGEDLARFARRCEIARDFARMDGEDSRFQRLLCR
jgi:serine/threonine protein kinase/tetratricopeptide (TPR) repeat protein